MRHGENIYQDITIAICDGLFSTQTVRPGARLIDLTKISRQPGPGEINMPNLPSVIIIPYIAVAMELKALMVKRRTRIADIIFAIFLISQLRVSDEVVKLTFQVDCLNTEK